MVAWRHQGASAECANGLAFTGGAASVERIGKKLARASEEEMARVIEGLNEIVAE
jgi:hypothetical protein